MSQTGTSQKFSDHFRIDDHLIAVEGLSMGKGKVRFNEDATLIQPWCNHVGPTKLGSELRLGLKLGTLNLPGAEREYHCQDCAAITLYKLDIRLDPRIVEARAKHEQEEASRSRLERERFDSELQRNLGIVIPWLRKQGVFYDVSNVNDAAFVWTILDLHRRQEAESK